MGKEGYYPEYIIATFETVSARTKKGDSDEYKKDLELRPSWVPAEAT